MVDRDSVTGFGDRRTTPINHSSHDLSRPEAKRVRVNLTNLGETRGPDGKVYGMTFE
jgi:hypothetical protein